MHKSIHKEIVDRITRLKKGTIVFPSVFHGLANTATIRTSLYRLVKDGTLIKLGQGIFLYPKTDPELGILYPSLEEVANAIAKRDNVQIKTTGIHAMQQLGLSTQVPMNVVFLSTGRSKKVKIGKHTITFKKTAPKKLAAKGNISATVIQALQEMAKGGEIELTPELRNKLLDLLSRENMATLTKDLQSAPSWIADIIVSILLNRNKNQHD